MANIKITELNAASSLAANDVLPVVDISTDETKKITSTNLFRTLPDGTAAAPALAFSSDQANGIYLAGTDTVGITTGGTQRVTVDASGNVVISGDLTVQGATTTVESTTVTIDDKNIELGSVASPSNTTADGGGITLKGASDKTIKWINSTGCWTFNQPTNFNDHVRIDSSGNVGIGASSPAAKLDIAGNQLFSAANPQIQFNGGGPIIRLPSANTLAFLTDSSNERMRIDSSGNLGLGTSSPGQLLHLNSSASTAIQISDGTNNQFISSIKTAGNFANGSTAGDILIRGQSGFAVSPNNGSSVALRIDSSGNVGIGQSNPSGRLEVNGGYVTLRSGASSYPDGISAPIIYGSTGGGSNSFDQTGNLVLQTRSDAGSYSICMVTGDTPTERLRIDSSGNVGIARSAPDNQLSIGSTASFETDANSFYLGSNFTGTGQNFIGSSKHAQRLFFNNASSNGYLSYANTGSAGTAGNAITWQERFRITSDGNIGIGTSAPDSTLELAAGPPRLKLTRNTTASTGNDFGRIVFENSAGTILSRIDCESTSGNTQSALTFSNGGSERLRIDASGNLGVGTTTPGQTDGAGLKVERYVDRNVTYYAPDGHYAGSFGVTNNTQDKVWIAIDSNYAKSSAVSAGLFLSAFHQDAGGSGCGSTIKNLKTGNALTFSTVATASGTGSPAVETERFRVDGAGNLGLGTTSPSNMLHINGSSPSIRLSDTGANGSAFSIIEDNNGLLKFRNDAGNSGTGSGIAFDVDGSEKLRLDSSGRLLVGTTTANGNMTVNMGTDKNISFNGSQGEVGSVPALVATNNSGSSLASMGFRATDLRFATGSAERLRINASGNVGIGTTSPTSALHVSANDPAIFIQDANSTGNSVNATLQFRDSSNTQLSYFGFASASDSHFSVFNTMSGGDLRFGTASTERLRIDSSGKVGIGTSSPQKPLNVVAAGTELIRLSQAVDGSTQQEFGIGWAANNTHTHPSAKITAKEFDASDSRGSLLFYTRGSNADSAPNERLRIDSSGNVGIGTAAPQSKLSVGNGASTDSGLSITFTGDNSTLAKFFANTATGEVTIGGVASNYFPTFHSNGSERMRIDSSGNIKVTFPDGNTGLRNKISFVTESPHQDETAYIAANRTAVNSAPTDLVFATGTASGASERMRIDSSGNVGIGTSSPVQQSGIGLHINNSSGQARLKLTNSASGATANDGFDLIAETNNDINFINHENAALKFSNNDIERMRITSAGVINVNGARTGFSVPMTGSGNLRVAATSAGGHALSTFDTINYTAVQFVREVSGSGAQVGTITCTDTSTSYNTSSDYRLKENVADLDGAITRIKQLAPKRFNFIVDDTTIVDGFLAHEAQVVVPEAVTGTHNEVDADGAAVMQGIDQSKLVPLLTAALQEAIAKIETLETKVAALEAG